jgi:hypothetical protein
MTEHKEVSAWLASMELDVSDPKKLFNLIDSVKRILAKPERSLEINISGCNNPVPRCNP